MAFLNTASRVVVAIILSIYTAGCMQPTVTPQQAPQNRQVLVTEVQTMLNGLGYNAGPVDGAAGRRTLDALAAFQRDRNLPTTGGVNEQAYAQLANARGSSTAASSGSANRVTSASTGASREAQEQARRRELSRNDRVVSFSASCPDLFIPEVTQKMHQGAVPVYAMRVLNNSNRRYSARYDITYTESGRNYFGRTGGQFTIERQFTSRPGGFTEFLIMERNKGNGTTVTSIDKITVFECRAA